VLEVELLLVLLEGLLLVPHGGRVASRCSRRDGGCRQCKTARHTAKPTRTDRGKAQEEKYTVWSAARTWWCRVRQKGRVTAGTFVC
jgi:hypothetical protein